MENVKPKKILNNMPISNPIEQRLTFGVQAYSTLFYYHLSPLISCLEVKFRLTFAIGLRKVVGTETGKVYFFISISTADKVRDFYLHNQTENDYSNFTRHQNCGLQSESQVIKIQKTEYSNSRKLYSQLGTNGHTKTPITTI